ncbi:hypothetical protein Q9L58_002251 [Maublancomyces gigas]|uniref:Uncharacterized protein n=1 Tax=Discina gigas TaxID=1032678 RepID=A0ABR3GS43_9PEZI
MALETAGKDPAVTPSEGYPARILTLFDMKMSGHAAVWADDTLEVAKLEQSSTGTTEEVQLLKRMFLNQFKKTVRKSYDLNRDLEVLHQGYTSPLRTTTR